MRNTDPPLLSKEELQIVRSRMLERRIYYFYFHAVKWAPVIVMVFHWYGLFDYASTQDDVLQTIQMNRLCAAFLYFLSYGICH